MEKRQDQNINYNLLIAKKTEKIVTAIYLISQFLLKEESIKIELRKEANKLLKDMFSLAFNDDAEENIFALYKKSLDSVSLIISYLYVAKDAGIISRMNVDIVIESLRILENILNKKQFLLERENLLINEEINLENVITGKVSISDLENNNFNTSLDVFTERNLIEGRQKNKSQNKVLEISKSESNDTENFHEEDVNKKPNINFSKGQNIKTLKDKSFKNQTDKNIVQIENKEKINKNHKNQDRKMSRRSQIISLFTKGTEVSINDISKKIIGCSVKTLQRELNDLVSEGKINRVGEKRWSKYILA